MADVPPTYRADPDAHFTDRLEGMLLQRLASPTSWSFGERRDAESDHFDHRETASADRSTIGDASVIRMDALETAPHRAPRRRMAAAVFAGAAAMLLVVALAATIRNTDDPSAADEPRTTVAAGLSAPFEGTWILDDVDSAREMDVQRAGDGYTVVVRDWGSNACLEGGGPFLTTRTGSIGSEGALVLEEATLACEDGGTPDAASGPSSITLTYDASADKVTDSTGVVWRRDGSAVWPQSSPDEVLDAQRRADAGDPTVAWQVDPRLDSGSVAEPPDFAQVEIFSRYLRDELGWEEFRTAEMFGGEGYAGRQHDGWSEVYFIRCAADATNAVYPDDPDGRDCAPSSDIENGYEHVGITVRQPVDTGPSGIWVVTSAGNIWPSEQVVPPSDAEASAYLEGFLRAAKNGGSEIEELGPAVWPLGERAVTIVHVAEDGTTVREHFELSREPQIGGSLRLTPSDG
jgi:hypothetical protein